MLGGQKQKAEILKFVAAKWHKGRKRETKDDKTIRPRTTSRVVLSSRSRSSPAPMLA